MTMPLRPRLTHDRAVDEIVAQAVLLADHLDGADLSTEVATCPGWNLAQLTRHVGEELRWLDRIVTTRAREMPDDTAMRSPARRSGRDGARTGAWIVAGAESLAESLGGAGPDAPIWTPVAGERTAFFARRFAHELLIHRADAALALGVAFVIGPETGTDALAEWMELGALPMMLDVHPERRALRGPGRTVRVTATDVDGPDATWLVDLAGDVPAHRPGTDEPATVELAAPLTDVLLVLYRRRRPDGATVTGDRALLDEWLGLSAFA